MIRLGVRLYEKTPNTSSIIMTISHDMILDADIEHLDRGDITSIVDYGVYANRSSITFIDKNKQFWEYRNKDLYATIYFYNLTKTKDIISLSVDNFNYNRETLIVELSLISPIFNFQYKANNRIGFENEGLTLGYLYVSALGKSFLSQFKTDAENRPFADYKVPMSYIDKPPYWSSWDEFCLACCCRIFDSPTYNLPYFLRDNSNNKTPIKIRPKNILSITNGGVVSPLSPSFSYTTRTKISKVLPELDLNINIYSIDATTGSIEVSQSNNENITIIEYHDGNHTDIRVSGTIDLSVPVITAEFKFPYSLNDYPATDYSNTYFYDFSNETENFYGGKVYQIANPVVEIDKSTYKKINFSFTILNARAYKDKVATNAPTFNRALISTNIKISCQTFEDVQTEENALDSSIEEKNIHYSGNLITSNDKYNEWLNDSKSIISRAVSTPTEYLECECLVSDYFGFNSVLEKSHNELDIFSHYDLVSPYIIRNNREQPYSKNNIGSSKLFRVIGVKYSYRGFLKQTLYLQENKSGEDIMIGYSNSSSSSIMLWGISLLEANTEYNVSWSLNKSLLDAFQIYTNANNYFCYYTYANGTVTWHPISTNIKDALNQTVSAVSNENGEIYIGVCYLSRTISNEENEALKTILKENTNHITAWKK